MDSASAVGPKIKGITVVHLARWLREHHGERAVDQVAARLSAPAAEHLRKAVAFEWYPLRDLVEMEVAVGDLFLGGDYSRIAEFGRWDSVLQVGLYRFLLQALNTDFLLKRSPKFWKNYCDSGVLTYQSLGPGHAELRLSGYDPLHRVHCHDLRGGFTGSIEACGGKDVQVVHPHCRLDGAAECLFDMRCR
jgi:hypothetical protein